jgi:hypothetical protein
MENLLRLKIWTLRARGFEAHHRKSNKKYLAMFDQKNVNLISTVKVLKFAVLKNLDQNPCLDLTNL